MDFLKNVSIKLRATGLVAALIVWVSAVAVVGVFGTGVLGEAALGMLSGGLGLIALLAGRSEPYPRRRLRPTRGGS
jgi:hypothetical protein